MDMRKRQSGFQPTSWKVSWTPGDALPPLEKNHKVRNLNYSLAVVWVGLYAHVLVLDTQTKRPSRRTERRDTPMYADQGWVFTLAASGRFRL